jgi:tRNA (cytidine/uridine-2'-O-)-methyltransferase
MLHIVLVEPEIPQNTGNIIRTCAATGSRLHLIRPLGFSLEDRYLKRAGLDYWPLAEIQEWDSLSALQEAFPQPRYWYATTRGQQFYTEPAYREGDMLVFGKETQGLPRDLLEKNPEHCIRIPMSHDVRARSLNLSNAAAIVVYEALRQLGFPDLS